LNQVASPAFGGIAKSGAAIGFYQFSFFGDLAIASVAKQSFGKVGRKPGQHSLFVLKSFRKLDTVCRVPAPAGLLAKSGAAIEFYQFSFFGDLAIAIRQLAEKPAFAMLRRGSQSAGKVGANPGQYNSSFRVAIPFFVGAGIPSAYGLCPSAYWRITK